MDTRSKIMLRSDFRQWRCEVSNRVFNIELLREIILDYAIHDGNNKKSSLQNAARCRLVSKAWCQSVTRVMFARQKPLLHIVLDPAKSDNITKFMRDVKGSPRRSDRIPPFALCTNSLGSLSPKSIQSFSKLLTSSGNSLVKWTLSFSPNQAPVSVNFSRILLPKLRLFKMELPTVGGSPVSDLNKNKLMIAQSVVDASTNLKSFVLVSLKHEPCLPNPLESFSFPSSITEVDLDCAVNNAQLEILLLKNSFPALKILKLAVICPPIKVGLITTMLENFRETLEQFCIREACSSLRNEATLFRLPLMKKLIRLEIHNEFIVLEEPCLSLERLVSKLNNMTLKRLPPSMFRRWTGNSCFPSVESLNVHLFDENYDGRYVTYSPRTMRALKHAFPNVHELEISLSEEETIALHFILMEMRDLRKLKICVDRSRSESGDSLLWGAILTGMTQDTELKEHLENDKYWKMLSKCKYSMRNLTELHTLELCTLTERGSSRSLISTFTFNIVFFKMPKLMKLVLKGEFGASKHMERKWLRDGRYIEIENYIPH